MPTRRQCANALRALAIDAIEQSRSGHPGAPLGMADMAEALWRHLLRHNPADPHWPDRDRFVLSNGHASMLLYGLLHLSGYALDMEAIRQFRQWGSLTPGHPEYRHTPGVEMTTGPLGQGISSAVGMALAEKLLAARFNRPGHEIVDHHTYVFLGDGCLMEGVSHEACSLAGVWGLGKLIALYDANGISIDGKVSGWFTEDVAARYRAYGWQVIGPVDGHDAEALDKALAEARADAAHPVRRPARQVQLPARHAGGTQLLPFRQLPAGVLPAALPVERESRDRSVADRHVADAAVPGPIVHIDPVREPVPAINRRRLGNPRTVRLRGGSGRQVPG